MRGAEHIHQRLRQKDECEHGAEGIRPCEFESGGNDAVNKVRSGGTHAASYQTGDGDVDTDERRKRNQVPVESNCDGRSCLKTAGMEIESEQTECEGIEEKFDSCGSSKSPQFSHQVSVISEGMEDSEGSQGGGEEICCRQDKHPCGAGDNGAPRCSADAHCRQAAFAEDEQIVEEDIGHCGQDSGGHDGSCFADTGEETAQTIPQETEDDAVQQDVKIDSLRGELFRGNTCYFEKP